MPRSTVFDGNSLAERLAARRQRSQQRKPSRVPPGGAVERQRADLSPESLLSFIHEHVQFKHAGGWYPFAFNGREYLRKPLTDLSEYVTITKSAQSCVSTIMRGQMFWLLDNGFDAGMFFPTKATVKRYTQKEINPVLNRSRYLRGRIVGEGVEEVDDGPQRKGGGRPDNLNVLALGDGLGVYAGMQEREEVESYALDALYLDEAALAMEIEDAGSEDGTTTDDWLRDRILNSPLHWQRRFSKPEIPGRNIDGEFLAGTQEHWAPRCSRHRSHRFPLETYWPDCLLGRTRSRGGTTYTKGHDLTETATFPRDVEWSLVCPKCDARLDWATAEWVAMAPNADHHSYRISQLYAPLMTAERLARMWQEANRKGIGAVVRFFVSILGRARAGRAQPLDSAKYNWGSHDCELPKASRRRESPGTVCLAGLDVGDLCHLVIHEARHDGTRRVVWVEELPIGAAKQLVPKRCKQFGNAYLVTDSGPHTETLREIHAALPKGTSALCWTSREKGVSVKWEEHVTSDKRFRLREINSPRHDNIDRLVENTMSGRIIYPRRASAATAMILQHHAAIIRDYDTDGNYRYRKGTPMHIGNAQDKAELAWAIRRRLGIRATGAAGTGRLHRKPRGM